MKHSSHLRKLEEDGYIVVRHVVADRPRVVVRLSKKGYSSIMDLVVCYGMYWGKLIVVLENSYREV